MEINHVIERIEDIGRIREILSVGIYQGKISNLVVNDAEVFKKAWKDKQDHLWERIRIIEQAMDDAYDIATKWENKDV